MPSFFICLGSVGRITHTPHGDTHPQKIKFRNFLEMPGFVIVNIPWDTYCDVIAGTIKLTKTMKLRQRKGKTVRQRNREINRFYSIKYCFGISNFCKTSKKIMRCHFSPLDLSVIESRSLF